MTLRAIVLLFKEGGIKMGTIIGGPSNIDLRRSERGQGFVTFKVRTARENGATAEIQVEIEELTPNDGTDTAYHFVGRRNNELVRGYYNTTSKKGFLFEE